MLSGAAGPSFVLSATEKEKKMKARKTFHYNKIKSLNSGGMSLHHHREGRHETVIGRVNSPRT